MCVWGGLVISILHTLDGKGQQMENRMRTHNDIYLARLGLKAATDVPLVSFKRIKSCGGVSLALLHQEVGRRCNYPFQFSVLTPWIAPTSCEVPQERRLFDWSIDWVTNDSLKRLSGENGLLTQHMEVSQTHIPLKKIKNAKRTQLCSQSHGWMYFKY